MHASIQLCMHPLTLYWELELNCTLDALEPGAPSTKPSALGTDQSLPVLPVRVALTRDCRMAWLVAFMQESRGKAHSPSQ